MNFDRELLRILNARGIVVGPNGEWVRSPTYAGSTPPTDEHIRYLNASAHQPDTNARLKRQWIESFWELVQALHHETPPGPFLGMFWIRLHGVLCDLRSEWLKLFQSVGVNPATHVPNNASLLEIALSSFRAMEAIRQALSEDELIYADYRRHTECHPTQSSYDVRWSQRAGGILERHGVPALGREYTVTELDAAIRRVLAAHPTEAAIAVAFARRIQPLVPPLVEVTRRLTTPTP
jgi:hypothetical protein